MSHFRRPALRILGRVVTRFGWGALPVVKMRWVSVLVAAFAAGALAGGTALAADRVFQPSGDQPNLKGVPSATLYQMGVSVSSARAPAYCGVVSLASQHGLSAPGPIGCPVSRELAEAGFRRAFPSAPPGLGVSSLAPATAPGGSVLDAALVRATVPSQPVIGRDRLAWLLVVQGAFPFYRLRPFAVCRPTQGSSTPAFGCRGVIGNLVQLVFVDAENAQYLTALPLGLSAGGVSIQGSAVARLTPTVVGPPQGLPAP
jgi:hypothetical protein